MGLANELAVLAALRRQGSLTESEFASAKRAVIQQQQQADAGRSSTSQLSSDQRVRRRRRREDPVAPPPLPAAPKPRRPQRRHVSAARPNDASMTPVRGASPRDSRRQVRARSAVKPRQRRERGRSPQRRDDRSGRNTPRSNSASSAGGKPGVPPWRPPGFSLTSRSPAREPNSARSNRSTNEGSVRRRVATAARIAAAKLDYARPAPFAPVSLWPPAPETWRASSPYRDRQRPSWRSHSGSPRSRSASRPPPEPRRMSDALDVMLALKCSPGSPPRGGGGWDVRIAATAADSTVVGAAAAKADAESDSRAAATADAGAAAAAVDAATADRADAVRAVDAAAADSTAAAAADGTAAATAGTAARALEATADAAFTAHGADAVAAAADAAIGEAGATVGTASAEPGSVAAASAEPGSAAASAEPCSVAAASAEPGSAAAGPQSGSPQLPPALAATPAQVACRPPILNESFVTMPMARSDSDSVRQPPGTPLVNASFPGSDMLRTESGGTRSGPHRRGSAPGSELGATDRSAIAAAAVRAILGGTGQSPPPALRGCRTPGRNQSSRTVRIDASPTTEVRDGMDTPEACSGPPSPYNVPRSHLVPFSQRDLYRCGAVSLIGSEPASRRSTMVASPGGRTSLSGAATRCDEEEEDGEEEHI